MQNFEYCVPTKVVFGRDTESRCGELVRECGGTHALVVYGGGSAVRSGLLGRCTDSLKAAGIPYELLGGVQPNPRLSRVREGIALAKETGADFLLAVGGGSVIDTAKAIAHGAANPETDIWEFWKRRAVPTRSTPVGVILTIPAAGSETSDSAVLTNEQEQEKRGLNTDLNRPAFAILDPKLAMTLPPRQVSCGVTDILMHTLDRYFTPADDNELTDELAEALLRVVIRNGPKVVENENDLHAMSEIMWCGSVSHNGLTGLGAPREFTTHQLGHALSEKFDAIHGETLSAMWGSWARYVWETKPARFARFARNVWDVDDVDADEAAMLGIEATENFFRSLHMPVSLGELKDVGVQSEEGLQELALRCSYQKTRTIGSFRVLGYDEMLEIYRLANH